MTEPHPIEESAAVASQPAAAPLEPAPPSGVVVAAAPAETPVVLAETVEPPAVPAVSTEEPPKPGESLLEAFDRKAAADLEAKKPSAPVVDPAAAPKPGEAPAAPVVEPAAPVVEPVAYEYALPETITMDDAQKGAVHAALDAFRADPAKGAQGLLDLHAKTMADYAAHMEREQHRVWNDTRKGWITEVMADQDLGGSGHQTAMGVVARMRDQFVKEADVPAFNEFLRVTGAGDHPQFLKLLHNVGRVYDEPAMPPPNPKPTPNNGQPPKRGMSSLYNK